MKLLKTCIAIFALVIYSFNSHAQRIKTVEGDLAALSSETSINIEFTYDNMSVGKYDKESEYIEKKKAEYNSKEPGRGDTWEKTWFRDRKSTFEPKFIELFEKTSGMKVSPDAKYTMVFHTTSTEPGFNIYVTRKNAEIDAEAIIYLSSDRSKPIAKIDVKNAPGRTFSGYDYATGDRIMECYAVAGKKLGKHIK